jgi:hypothetical protein
MRRRAQIAILPAVLFVACKGSDNAAPSASAQPSAAPVASVLATASPNAKSDFFVVAEAPEPFNLSPLAGAGFVEAAGFLAQLDDNDLHQKPSAMRGLEHERKAGLVEGTWPDAAWLFAGDKTFKWVKDRWAESSLLREGETLRGMSSWNEGRLLAAIAMPNHDLRFALLGGKTGVVLPAPSPPEKSKDAPAASATPAASAAPAVSAAPPVSAVASASAAPVDSGSAAVSAAPAAPPVPTGKPEEAEKEDGCKIGMESGELFFIGLSTGHVFATARACTPTGPGDALVEHWSPKQVHGVVEALPKPASGAGITPRGVLARSDKEAFVWGKAGEEQYLASFDGKSWKVEKPLEGATILRAWVAADGAVFLVTEGGKSTLWKKEGAGAFAPVSLPEDGGRPMVAKGVWARSATDVWVTAATSTGYVLLHTAAPKEKVTLSARSVMEEAISNNHRYAATAACDKPYAHLATIGRGGAPVPNDFPAIKAAFAGNKDVAGVTFVVEDDGAGMYLGAQAPSIEVAKNVVSLFKEKNPRAIANVFCHEPNVKKTIALE